MRDSARGLRYRSGIWNFKGSPFNFARGGAPETSQKLMRWRVLMQFVALVVIMLTIWVMGR